MSRFSIHIYCLEPLPLVRPILEIDIQLLENEFVSWYREGDRVLYVPVMNNLRVSSMVTEEMLKTWSPLWQEIIDNFEKKLLVYENLLIF